MCLCRVVSLTPNAIARASRNVAAENVGMGVRVHSADELEELASSQFLPFFSPAKRLTTKKETMILDNPNFYCARVEKSSGLEP
jgi:hypothetical protein